MAISTVLFDLDGTLSDSAPGILASLRHALAAHGIGPLTPEQERALLGPPFYETLPPIVGRERTDSVIVAYRAHYNAGSMFDTVAYPGIAELLDALTARGVTLAVATSKPEPQADRIVAHLGFTDRFATICGDTLDGARRTKAAVIAEALSRLGDPAPSRVLMVGDRRQDVVGAASHGIGCLGAGWGYGGGDELDGAVAVYPSAGDLLAALPGLLAG